MTIHNLRSAALAVIALVAIGAHAPPTQPARRALSGDLTKPLAQYTGAQFATLTRRLRYGQGAERQRKCRGPAECSAGRLVTVRADAVADADSLSPTNLPRFGVIAARIRNRGVEMEERYNMRGGAQYSYYLIVLPATNGRATWILEELDTQGSVSAHRTVASGRFTPCNHQFARGARADFKTCAQAAGGTTISLASFGGQGPDDPPIWIGCAAGCCIAESGT
ncbi:MAG TPA: hypothetical protein VFO55_10255 [Gemmatimonadaceae bacterium]|nr:hypothetical protein [Gemmatimonadaceae bacterium]